MGKWERNAGCAEKMKFLSAMSRTRPRQVSGKFIAITDDEVFFASRRHVPLPWFHGLDFKAFPITLAQTVLLTRLIDWKWPSQKAFRPLVTKFRNSLIPTSLVLKPIVLALGLNVDPPHRSFNFPIFSRVSWRHANFSSTFHLRRLSEKI